MQLKINKMIAIVILAILLFANVFPVVSIAAEEILSNDNTSYSDVKFSVTFANNETETEASRKDGIVELFLKVKVGGQGYFDNTKIDFTDSNFEIIDDGNENYDEIKNNQITINKIASGEERNFVVRAKAKEFGEEINVNELYKTSTVKFSGKYTNTRGEIIDVKAQKYLNLSWKQDSSSEINQTIEKYLPVRKDNKTKLMVQEKLVSFVAENNNPIEKEIITIKVPKINDNLPETVVINGTTAMTNGDETGINFTPGNYSYDSVKEELRIVVLNNPNEENRVSWKQDAKDEFIIIYVYDENVFESVKETGTKIYLNASSDITFYDKKQTTVSVNEQKEVEVKDNIGSIVSMNVFFENDISKGFMETNTFTSGDRRDTEYKEHYSVNVSYAQIVDSIEINADQETFKNDSATYALDTRINKIQIKQEEFVKILGEDGYVKVFDENQNEVLEITKDLVDIDISALNLNKLTIKTSSPITEGNIDFVLIKVIKGENYLDREFIDGLTTINEVGSARVVNDDEVIAEGNFDISANMVSTSSKATLSINKDNLVADQKNERVEIKATLETSNIENTLYKNPKLQFILPEEFETIENINVNLSEDDELIITGANYEIAENGSRVITIDIEGTQTKYNTVTAGTEVTVTADITMNEYATYGEYGIDLLFYNENDKLVRFENIGVNLTGPGSISSTDLIKTLSHKTILTVDEYSGNTEKVVNLSTDSLEKTYNVETTLVNRMNDVNNIKVLGRFPQTGVKSFNDGTSLGNTVNTTVSSVSAIYGKDAEILTKIADRMRKNNPYLNDKDVTQILTRLYETQKQELKNKSEMGYFEYVITMKSSIRNEFDKYLNNAFRPLYRNRRTGAYTFEIILEGETEEEREQELKDYIHEQDVSEIGFKDYVKSRGEYTSEYNAYINKYRNIYSSFPNTYNAWFEKYFVEIPSNNYDATINNLYGDLFNSYIETYNLYNSNLPSLFYADCIQTGSWSGNNDSTYRRYEDSARIRVNGRYYYRSSYNSMMFNLVKRVANNPYYEDYNNYFRVNNVQFAPSTLAQYVEAYFPLKGSEIIIYYSEKADATEDLGNVSNGWSTTPNANAKSYLVCINNFNMSNQSYIKMNYAFTLPDNILEINDTKILQCYKIICTNTNKNEVLEYASRNFGIQTVKSTKVLSNLKAVYKGKDITYSNKTIDSGVDKYQKIMNASAEFLYEKLAGKDSSLETYKNILIKNGLTLSGKEVNAYNFLQESSNINADQTQEVDTIVKQTVDMIYLFLYGTERDVLLEYNKVIASTKDYLNRVLNGEAESFDNYSSALARNGIALNGNGESGYRELLSKINIKSFKREDIDRLAKNTASSIYIALFGNERYINNSIVYVDPDEKIEFTLTIKNVTSNDQKKIKAEIDLKNTFGDIALEYDDSLNKDVIGNNKVTTNARGITIVTDENKVIKAGEDYIVKFYLKTKSVNQTTNVNIKAILNDSSNNSLGETNDVEFIINGTNFKLKAKVVDSIGNTTIREETGKNYSSNQDDYVAYVINLSALADPDAGSDTVKDNVKVRFNMPEIFTFLEAYISDKSGRRHIEATNNGKSIEINIDTLNVRGASLEVRVKAGKLPQGVYVKQVINDDTRFITVSYGELEQIAVLDDVYIHKPGLSIVQRCSNTTGIINDNNTQDEFYFEFEVNNLSGLNMADITLADILPTNQTLINFIEGTIETTNYEERYDDEGNQLEDELVIKTSSFYSKSENGYPQIKFSLGKFGKAIIRFKVAGGIVYDSDYTITSYGKLEYDNEVVDTNTIMLTLKRFDLGQGTEVDKSLYKSISGMVWLDENNDGVKDKNEKVFEGLQVALVNQDGKIIRDEDNGEPLIVTTTATGTYLFPKVRPSYYYNNTYRVVVLYDNVVYTINGNNKQKNGVDEAYNQDFYETNVRIDGTLYEKQAVSDSLTVTNDNLFNIDCGLVLAERSDLAVTMKVNRVVIISNEGRRILNYDTDLAQLSLTQKQVQESNILIEYKILIENKGTEVESNYELVNTIPSGLKYISYSNDATGRTNRYNIGYKDPDEYSLNVSNWSVSGNKARKIISESLSPGQIAETYIVLTLTNEQLVNYLNINGLNDTMLNNYIVVNTTGSYTESKPEDNSYNANIVITMSTGQALVYTGLAVTVLIILGVGVFLIKKNILDKEVK